MKLHTLIPVFLLCMAVSLSSFTALAHERDEHDDDIERVLFGEENYKTSHTDVADIIQALEDATYLAVDQFNGYGQDALDNLQGRKIRGIPSNISEIDFTSNYAHRSLTHRGWDMTYPEKAHWEIRKAILINTVEQELFIDSDTPLSWFPWLSEKVYGRNGSEKQEESFCILLYYTHVIGDHIEAEKYQDLVYVAPLVRPNDRDNPGIIPELINCFHGLFEDQTNTFTYSGLIQELEVLQADSERIMKSPGGINSEEKFKEYHQCAETLLETLETNVPQLLKNEAFFGDNFY